MTTTKGKVSHITFQNPDNGFTVLRVKNTITQIDFAAVGFMVGVYVGQFLELTGKWETNRFGDQFRIEKWEEILPVTVEGIEKYLSSGMIKGIGPKYAKRIVSAFGIDTFNIIEREPDKLLSVEGIGVVRLGKIRKSWEDQKEIKNIMIFLQNNNISTTYAAKIYKKYGNDSLSVIRENPYRLAEDIRGVGFKSADDIARKLGIEKNATIRLVSGIQYTLKDLSNSGHVFAKEFQLINRGCRLLDVNKEDIKPVLEQMVETKALIADKDAIYLPALYRAEINVATKLKYLIHESQCSNASATVDVAEIESYLDVTYDEIQAAAIRKAMTSKVMVLTGGPGTGKTTTTQGMIKGFQMHGLDVRLAAPTGRAAKRMTEATGLDAQTIHRLLCYGENGFEMNEENPLDGDVLIVDECSMIDLKLMDALIKAIPHRMTLILVGDIDQLPSVGAGNVLRDIMDSEVCPVVRLTRIFRQAQTSQIVLNAHRINEGKYPLIAKKKDKDFYFFQQENLELAAKDIVQLVSKRIPNYFDIDPRDIQVLTPMKKGEVGTLSLNIELQKALNPNSEGLERGKICYRENDKVMQIRNNYKKGVFNGDIGYISSVDTEEKTLIVEFDTGSVEYENDDLDELVHAYATTIHKSQGSEYPVVIMPVTMNHYIMLQRNLIYTGVTRAKKLLILIGTKKAVEYSVEHVTATKRNSLLKERLQELTV